MKQIKFFIALMLITWNATAQLSTDTIKNSNGKTIADLLWETNPEKYFNQRVPREWRPAASERPKNDHILTAEESKIYRKQWISFQRLMELWKRECWDWGIYFWNAFPNDPRRFDWFKNASGRIPMFYKNLVQGAEDSANDKYIASIDLEAYQAWKSQYLKMKTEYLASSVSKDDSIVIMDKELGTSLMHFRYADLRKQITLENIKEQIIGLAPYGKTDRIRFGSKQEAWLLDRLRTITEKRQAYGLNYQDMLSFFQSLTTVPHVYLSDYAHSKVRLYSLMTNGFSIKHKLVGGKSLDTEKMTQKLVFIDFWNLGCKSCINAMPKIKAIRDKYSQYGFEVISVSTDNESYKKNVLKIHDKIGADWPLMIIGGNDKSGDMGGLGKEIWDRYGFTGVPQTLLLDENRKVIAYKPKLSELENLIKEHLVK